MRKKIACGLFAATLAVSVGLGISAVAPVYAVDNGEVPVDNVIQPENEGDTDPVKEFEAYIDKTKWKGLSLIFLPWEENKYEHFISDFEHGSHSWEISEYDVRGLSEAEVSKLIDEKKKEFDKEYAEVLEKIQPGLDAYKKQEAEYNLGLEEIEKFYKVYSKLYKEIEKSNLSEKDKNNLLDGMGRWVQQALPSDPKFFMDLLPMVEEAYRRLDYIKTEFAKLNDAASTPDTAKVEDTSEKDFNDKKQAQDKKIQDLASQLEKEINESTKLTKEEKRELAGKVNDVLNNPKLSVKEAKNEDEMKGLFLSASQALEEIRATLQKKTDSVAPSIATDKPVVDKPSTPPVSGTPTVSVPGASEDTKTPSSPVSTPSTPVAKSTTGDVAKTTKTKSEQKKSVLPATADVASVAAYVLGAMGLGLVSRKKK